MRHATPRPQRGFAAIAAIFLVVVLAALGGFMVTFSNTQQLTSAQDLQGSRAYWAARAGLEWGIGSVVDCANNATTCVKSVATPPPNCPMSPTWAAPFEGGFNVTVTCTRTDYTEDAATANKFIYQFTSKAFIAGSLAGSVGFIERSVSASIECAKVDPVAPSTFITYLCG